MPSSPAPTTELLALACLGLYKALTLNQLHLCEDLPPDDELAAVYMVATGLKFIWEARLAKKQTSLFQVRAELEAKISMLRRTRHQGAGLKIQEMLDS